MPSLYTREQLMAMSTEERETLKNDLLAKKAAMSQQTQPYAQARPTLGQTLGKALLMGTQAYTTGKVPEEAFKTSNTEPDWYTKQIVEQQIKQNAPMTEKDRAELEYKKGQTQLNQAVYDAISGGQGGDLVYRDPATGQEVPPEQARMDITQGKQYIIKRRVASKQGIKEEPISEPQTLSSEAAGLVGSIPSMQGSIDNILAMVQDPKFKWGFMGDVRTAMGNPYLVGGGLEKLQSELNNLKKTAFAEGGKQLTGTEKQIVFRALEPGGKDISTWIGELQRAKQVMENKARLMVKNPNIIQNQGENMPSTNVPDYNKNNDPLGLR